MRNNGPTRSVQAAPWSTIGGSLASGSKVEILGEGELDRRLKRR
jgi:hypothetical protein